MMIARTSLVGYLRKKLSLSANFWCYWYILDFIDYLYFFDYLC